ncbi:unnamed protein product [Phytophthora fragariaefolia]|uniref:Unnamed protein product n=1 Tax=Phytophthora fragariaefolia TaxID=1490495 RepID=A0A9W6YAT0_9STRA|nr:unnamed protein product [Phytophthora fragariaefolia]
MIGVRLSPESSLRHSSGFLPFGSRYSELRQAELPDNAGSVPRSSAHSPLRPVPNRRDTLNDTIHACPDNAQLKTKTHAGSDNAAQDRVGPDNTTQPARTRRPDNRARLRARQENRRIKNKTVPVRKTIYSRFK